METECTAVWYSVARFFPSSARSHSSESVRSIGPNVEPPVSTAAFQSGLLAAMVRTALGSARPQAGARGRRL